MAAVFKLGQGEREVHAGKGNSEKVVGAKLCGHRWDLGWLESGAGEGEASEWSA